MAITRRMSSTTQVTWPYKENRRVYIIIKKPFSMGLVTRLYLIRHAQSEDNVNQVISGHRQTPLTSLGHKQARSLSWRIQWVPIDVLVSSDLPRAVQTVDYLRSVLGKKKCVYDARLREQSLGEHEGMEYGSEWMSRGSQGIDFTPVGGESESTQREKIRECLYDLFDNYSGRRVAIVTHNDVLKYAVPWLTGTEHTARPHRNTALSVLDINWIGHGTIHMLADTRHLQWSHIQATFRGWYEATHLFPHSGIRGAFRAMKQIE